MKENHLTVLLFVLGCLIFTRCDDEKPDVQPSVLQLSDIKIGTIDLEINSAITKDAPVDKPIVATFSSPLVISSVQSSVSLKETSTGEIVPLTFSFLNDNKSF